MSLDPQTILTLVGKTVASYVSGNTVPPELVADLIRSVHATFVGLEQGTPDPAVVAAPEPAVPIKKSVFPNYIVCLEDGKKLKVLKRHLRVAYGMTPDDYRERWTCPPPTPWLHRTTP